MSPQRDMPETLRAVLRRLPTTPGVYLMKSAAGRVLYVGKADSLRSRVRSYFASDGDHLGAWSSYVLFRFR